MALLSKAFLFNTMTFYAYENEPKYLSKYEYNNCIERWILSVINADNPSLDAFFDTKNLTNSDAKNQLIHELKEKSNASVATNDIVAFVQTMIDQLIQLATDQVSITQEIQHLKPYFKALVKPMVILDPVTKTHLEPPLDANIILSMLYEGLAKNQSQQWSAPLKLYKYLYSEHNLQYEGFASPFNSKLLKIDPKAHYCSIFYDPIDKFYGSIGSFFQTDFPANSTWYINPPFIVSLFEKTWQKLQSELKKENGQLIFLNLPYWSDLELISDMMKSKYCIKHIILRKNQHHYETPNNKSIVAKFNSILLVFSSASRIQDSKYARNPAVIDENAIIKAFK